MKRHNIISKLLITLIFILVLGNSLSSQQRISRNGNCFTPKDSIKVLLVFVGFGDNDVLFPTGVWPDSFAFPRVVEEGKLFYDDFSMFDLPIDEGRDIENISRWYYEQSKFSGRPLKLIADAFRVDVFT